MKNILLALILVTVSNLTFAKDETATGYGSSFQDALQNAKSLVTEQAASTFVSSKHEVHDGKLNETIAQYNGGFIRKYDVLNTVVNDGLFEVTIKADVDTDKINNVIEAASADVTDPIIEAATNAADNEEKTKHAWHDLSSVVNMYAVKINNVHYVTQNGTVTANYNVNVVWNPKWFNDAKNLADATALPATSRANKAMCFNLNACFLVAELPKIYTPDLMTFTATIHFVNGTTMTRPWTHKFGQQFIDGRNLEVKQSGFFSPTRDVYAMIFFGGAVVPMDMNFEISLEQFRNVREITIDADSSNNRS